MKMISDVDGFITNKVLPEYSNFELKKNERMRVFSTQDGHISWQRTFNGFSLELF